MACACPLLRLLTKEPAPFAALVARGPHADEYSESRLTLAHVWSNHLHQKREHLRVVPLPRQGWQACCLATLLDYLAAISPQVVLACGNDALSVLLGKRGITRERGVASCSPDLPYWVYPTLTPSVTTQRPAQYEVLARDISDALTYRERPRQAPPSPSWEVTYDVLDSLDAVATWCHSLRSLARITFDIETGGGEGSSPYSGGYLLALGLGIRPDHTLIIPRLLLSQPPVREELAHLFACHGPRFTAHNGKFDVQYLRVYLGGAPVRCDDDTMLMHYALCSDVGVHGLKELASLYCKAGDYEKGLKQYVSAHEPAADHEGRPYGRHDYARIPSDILHRYLAYDCAYTYQLAERFLPQVAAEGKAKLYQSLLMPIAALLTDVEAAGLGVDQEYAARKREEYTVRLGEVTRKLQRSARAIGWHKPVELGKKGQPLKKPEGYYDFNPGSPLQVAGVLYDILKVEAPQHVWSRRSDGSLNQRPTDREAIEAILERAEHPVLADLLEHRVVSKILGTYLEGVAQMADPAGRIHGRFNVHGTETGRLSSADPNLQNIPRSSRPEGKDVKNLFVPLPGYEFLQADYSQAEYRVAGVLSRDPFLWQTYAIDRKDLHSSMARALFGETFTDEQRTRAKTCNFLAMYGGGATVLANKLKIRPDEAQEILSGYWAKMPVLQDTINSWRLQAVTTGLLATPFGRTRRWDTRTEKPYKIEKEAGNFPIQSVASDLMLLALLDVHPQLAALNRAAGTLVARIVTTVHDSVLLEVLPKHMKTVAQIVYKAMVTVPKRTLGTALPFEADFDRGPAWGSMTKWKEWQA